MKRFKPIVSSTPDLGRVQNAIEDSFGPLTSKEIIDGRLVKGSVDTVGVLLVHALGRPCKGVIVVKASLPDGSDFSGSVREVTASGSNPDPTKYVKMVSTAGTPNVSLWVF